MITHDQILPSLYQMQRRGEIGDIAVCARREETLRSLRESATIQSAFPDRCFHSTTKPYSELIAALPPEQIVVIALPDQAHYAAVMTALQHQQHVICVKPLVLKAAESLDIERTAREQGLFVGIEYHKRLDDRSLMARRKYREGQFGEFKLGTASLMEKWYYRHSNFQNWCTTENSDTFTYIGCHYVDLVHFVTGLLPASVSVYGVRDRYPNGNEGFLWTDARVIWNNGACLNIQNTLSFPDEAPGTNTQGITMYCSDGQHGGMIKHSDQYRGIEYCYVTRPDGPGTTAYAEPSADYFQYLPLGGPGLTPVGYGVRSIEHLVNAAKHIARCPSGPARQQALTQLDRESILATPANSRYNELVTEAGRLSILNEARTAVIDHEKNEVHLA